MVLPQKDDPNFLMVEGPDDKGVCVAFLLRCNLRACVHAEDGYEALRETIEPRLMVKGRRALGVVVDADESLAARWRSLQDAVAPLGYALPEQPEPAGTVIEMEGRPRLGIWLMPDNTLNGMLEDFVAVLVPNGDSLFPRAGAAVGAIPAPERQFKDAHLPKAHIHTWLAWQAEPGRPMGQAITKRFLDGDCAEAARFADWLRRLFG
ncbi:DUF3226 domain-containing protein [Magnetospirillum sp. UT-4]|uniref:DUF3226 domain-containing protein n=1 Tax=Magnetospirillum sp. UT-4 TaxID=2681467 RepID=UPI0013829EA7|nr:DUF3226 domain-containing protein [Magnetospirillum sp. UT-4]CAA7623830.1 conserved hypothetical protein [Magnetospirillum sp. UT-4]